MAIDNPYLPSVFVSNPVQDRRRKNLGIVLRELERDGVESSLLVDQVLGMRTGTLADVRKGADITDVMAREIEWSMNRPPGWLDRGTSGDGI